MNVSGPLVYRDSTLFAACDWPNVSRTIVFAVGFGQTTSGGRAGIRKPDTGRFGSGSIHAGAGTQFCVTLIPLFGSVYLMLEWLSACASIRYPRRCALCMFAALARVQVTR